MEVGVKRFFSNPTALWILYYKALKLKKSNIKGKLLLLLEFY